MFGASDDAVDAWVTSGSSIIFKEASSIDACHRYVNQCSTSIDKGNIWGAKCSGLTGFQEFRGKKLSRSMRKVVRNRHEREAGH